MGCRGSSGGGRSLAGWRRSRIGVANHEQWLLCAKDPVFGDVWNWYMLGVCCVMFQPASTW